MVFATMFVYFLEKLFLLETFEKVLRPVRKVIRFPVEYSDEIKKFKEVFFF